MGDLCATPRPFRLVPCNLSAPPPLSPPPLPSYDELRYVPEGGLSTPIVPCSGGVDPVSGAHMSCDCNSCSASCADNTAGAENLVTVVANPIGKADGANWAAIGLFYICIAGLTILISFFRRRRQGAAAGAGAGEPL
jgi:hypothetical protein